MKGSAATRLRMEAGSNVDDSIGAHAQNDVIPIIHQEDHTDGLSRLREAFWVPVHKIQPDPKQPRKEFAKEDIEFLANSIKRVGILQPIRVRWDDGLKRHVIISGERRWHASMLAGLKVMPAISDDAIDPDNVMTHQLIENCQRVDLNPVEKSNAIKQLMTKESWTQARVAEELGFTPGYISKLLTIVNMSPDEQVRVASGEIGIDQAYTTAKESRTATGVTRLSKRQYSVTTSSGDMLVTATFKQPGIVEGVFLEGFKLLQRQIAEKLKG